MFGDCNEQSDEIEDGSVDLVVTDPPYNAKKGFPNDNLPNDEFLSFTRRWGSMVARKLKDTGSFYCFINDNYYIPFRNIFDELLTYRRTIIWHFEGFFNNPGDNYDSRYEYVLFYTKGDDYTFNKIKEPPSNSYLERWSPCADKNGDIPWDKLSPTEKVRYNRENYEKNPKNIHRGLYQGNCIYCPRPRYKDHPTQKPERLVSIFIEESSIKGDLVFDPFCGTGTTVIVSKKLGRVGMGFEILEKYFDIGKRILSETFEGEELKNTLWKRDEKKGITRLDQFT